MLSTLHWSGVLQCFLLEGLDASAFARSAREMTGKGNAHWATSRRPYQVAFLVKTVTMASLLRSTSSMCEVLSSAAGILLPAALQPAFSSMLRTCKHCIPHESTVSRWKLLLDGSFMLLHRQLNQKVQSGNPESNVIRYLMADASTQHGREFEHIMIASISKSELGRLFRSTRSLLEQWPLCHLFCKDVMCCRNRPDFLFNETFDRALCKFRSLQSLGLGRPAVGCF